VLIIKLIQRSTRADINSWLFALLLNVILLKGKSMMLNTLKYFTNTDAHLNIN